MTRSAARLNRRTLVAGTAVSGATLAFPRTSREAAAAPAAAQHLPDGYALVTSLRLTLPGIGGDQVAPLVQGAHTSWAELGSPMDRLISPMALDGVVPDGMTPVKTAKDYAALVALFDADPGAFAVLPLDQIDFQVNTLQVDGVDPLHATGTDADPIIRIGACGDIIPGRNVANYIRKYDDFTMPFQRVKSVTSSFDITFANFECFISETLESPELVDDHALDFLTRPQFVPGMVEAGISAVNMANNHAVYSHAGWGLPAFKDTYTFLTQGGVPVFGAGMDLDEARAPWVAEVKGKTIAIIGIDGVTGNIDYPTAAGVQVNAGSQATADHGGTNPLEMANITADITRLAGMYDIVIPFFHMSEQYIWTPMDWAITTAHQAIDAGATMVISSHPHTIQGWEVYAGKPIFHSIGNFVYDQMFSVDTRQGYVLELTMRGDKPIGFRVHSFNVENFCQPRFHGPAEASGFMDRFWTSTDLRIKNSTS